MFWLWVLLIYWFILFVACYIVTESGQNYFYDEVTPHAGLKVAAASLILAAALTWWNPEMLDMITTDIPYTFLLAILAFVLFIFVIRFHPPHAAAVGPITVILIAALTALAIESLGQRSQAGRREVRQRVEPLRKGAGTGIPVNPPTEDQKSATPAKEEAETR